MDGNAVVVVTVIAAVDVVIKTYFEFYQLL